MAPWGRGSTRYGDKTGAVGDYVAAAIGGTRQYHVAPDGRFLMLKDVASEAGDELPPQVVLVQNWFEELRQRMGN